ncbi:hypothetical protein [Enterococcus faecium]|uniref:hypothetical protein n=1 Tax=Enterococcus faecium TaxID=1352 RepID=UPI00133182DE|nr:hypothetical protein [Enterococcus faecium]MDV4793129.1 hypothetical protein [Enterococcus faecium]HAP7855201.1 hypothetical protein [Enterococcus faecium]HAQ7067122.1 hypothetical protein [Enterococcus faecium]HBC2643005.1 hypothetical protein [Enterococcus faecium]
MESFWGAFFQKGTVLICRAIALENFWKKFGIWKIWGGYYDPPIVCRVPIFVPKSALSLLYQWIEPFFFDRHLTAVLTAVLKNRKKY